MTFLEAVGRMEGFGVPGDRPTRDNDPGDIEYGPFTKAHGAISSDGRFAIFPDAATGFAALHALLTGPAYRGLTVSQAINKYAPPNENNTVNYVNSICRWVGCKPTDIIDSLL